MIDAAELRRLVEAWEADAIDIGINGPLAAFLIAHASELLALVEADQWRTMESAPKDRLIDIWIKNSDGQGVRWTNCYYDQITDQWRTAPGGYLMWVPAKAVTHWRPLPKEPAQ